MTDPVTWLILIATLGAGALLFLPWLRGKPVWRAMITPLASIIGSGFLVLGPILAHSYGAWAPLMMVILCAGAWAFGSAIRANIKRLGDSPESPSKFESLSSALLALAYVISVAYYLNLLGSFAVQITPWHSHLAARIVTTAVFGLIVFLGYGRGFAMLEKAEYLSVTIKLAIITGLIVGLALFFAQAARTGGLFLPELHVSGLSAITLGFGLLVTVQGFETSRYLGESYDAKTRRGSMQLAQGISAGIYVIYVVLLVYAHRVPPGNLSETAIIGMMQAVSPILPGLLILAALAAQFSAAVADTGGAGGLIEELTRKRITSRQGYAVLCAIGLILTWTSDVFQIIAYASRAFALYYAAQAAIAARAETRIHWRILWGALALLGLAIAIFGQPAEG